MKFFTILFCIFFSFLTYGASDANDIVVQCPNEILFLIFDNFKPQKKEFFILSSYNDQCTDEEITWQKSLYKIACVSKTFSRLILQYLSTIEKQLLSYCVKGLFFEEQLIMYRPLFNLCASINIRFFNQFLKTNDNIFYKLKELNTILLSLRGAVKHEFIIIWEYRNNSYVFSRKNAHNAIKVTCTNNGECEWLFVFGGNIDCHIEKSSLKKLFLHNDNLEYYFGKTSNINTLYCAKSLIPSCLKVKNQFSLLNSLQLVSCPGRITLDLSESFVKMLYVSDCEGTVMLPLLIDVIDIKNNLFFKKYFNVCFNDKNNEKRQIELLQLNINNTYACNLFDQNGFHETSIKYLILNSGISTIDYSKFTMDNIDRLDLYANSTFTLQDLPENLRNNTKINLKNDTVESKRKLI